MRLLAAGELVLYHVVAICGVVSVGDFVHSGCLALIVGPCVYLVLVLAALALQLSPSRHAAASLRGQRGGCAAWLGCY